MTDTPDHSDPPSLEEQTQQVVDEAKRDLEATRDEFEGRLASLENRAATARKHQEIKKAEDERRMKSDQSSASGLGVSLSIAYSIIGLPVAGFLIGLLIIRQGGSSSWRDGLILVGAFAGVFYAIFMLNRLNRRG